MSRRIVIKAPKEQSSNVEPDETVTKDEEVSNDEEFAGLINIDPKSVKVALAAPEADEWKIAMKKEFDALMKNET